MNQRISACHFKPAVLTPDPLNAIFVFACKTVEDVEWS